jgi:hypothetical protein
MTLTPSMKGSFLAGVGLWLMLWLSLFKLDEVVGDTRMKRWASADRCLDWIAHHRSTTLLGTELCNYGSHGIADPNSVVFAAGGTLVNMLFIFLALPARALFKAKR